MAMNKVLLVATRNPGKKKEIQQILRGLPITIINLEDISKQLPEIIEDGATFAENAVKKAREIAALSGYICLADDSGLEVDALEGRPGVYSARFAGEPADDGRNNVKLLNMLQGIELKDRTARFVCCIAISDPRGNSKFVTGKCEGRIGLKASGREGFGYDPLFIPEGEGRSFAELSPEAKNSISHRAQALRTARPIIEEFF